MSCPIAATMCADVPSKKAPTPPGNMVSPVKIAGGPEFPSEVTKKHMEPAVWQGVDSARTLSCPTRSTSPCANLTELGQRDAVRDALSKRCIPVSATWGLVNQHVSVNAQSRTRSLLKKHFSMLIAPSVVCVLVGR